ncbi:tyrosine-type recombinase/integrase [Vibrio lentus]|uniref:tyrosine-type recombinase/integrase n=1 Tax=Vibrio lentus TaxID=136468 RepID=UPI00178CCFDF|nr:tyrosine-type recombinase/integrase [Vibrio lentus]MDN3631445.1 tyrosine-type recombinase/integrase [Vibrio lentus]
MESMIRKTKNIVKRELKTSDGVIFYSFMSKETGRVVELEEHINGMIMNSHPYNTVSAKASDLAKFYDYYIEASRVIHSSEYLSDLQDNHAYSASHELRTSLTLIFHSYPAFLLDGKLSKNPLARICAYNLDSASYARDSVTRYISTLCDFVSASNALENSLKQQRKMDGLIDVDQSLTAVGKDLGLLRELSVRERNVLIEHSYLASCISGGAKVSKIKNFFRLPKESKGSQDKHFPMEYVGEFLLNTKSHRDRAMYALCFGGGLRFSETSSIRIQDIDVVKEKVRLHDKGTISYLDAMNYTCMRGKPISHFSVKLIEPFKSFFFNELMMYIDKERPNSNSEYLFLQLRGTKNKLTGEMVYHPCYKSATSTIKDVWDRNLKRAGLTGKEFGDIGTHSMRHYYGMYMLNFAPNDIGGTGYSLEEVKFFMRHSSIKSTEIYAKNDISKMIEKVEETNRQLQMKELSFYEESRKNQLTVINNESK